MVASSNDSARSALNETIINLVLATAPAVAAYISGWAYLYFYLDTFGIDISELDFDVRTIAIYSFPLFRYFAKSYVVWVALALVAVVVALGFLRPQIRRAVIRRMQNVLRGTPFLAKALFIYAAVVLAIPSILTPVVEHVAVYQASLRWSGIRSQTQVNLDAVTNLEGQSQIETNFAKCANRRGLDLLIADKQTVFLLCKSTIDPTAGVVYEVRRDGGNFSVRDAHRALPENGQYK